MIGLACYSAWPTMSAAYRGRTKKGKPYVFPAGRYILRRSEAATGDDYTELMEDFILKPSQFILSGGPNPTDDCSSTTIWKFRRATRRCLSTTMRLHESSQT